MPTRRSSDEPPSRGTYPDVRLDQLVELSVLQEIQDAFADATGVGSMITDPEGRPITRPSNFCRLCSEIIRKTEKGLANCMLSDAVIGRPNPDGPIIQPCLSGGLWNGGASITVGNRHIANWLIGQVRNQSTDVEAMLAYARSIGADEAAFQAALDQVTSMPRERFESVCRAMFLIARQISTMAYQNMRLLSEAEERTRVEHELRQSEARFREVLANAELCAIILDAEANILFCNDFLLRRTGRNGREVMGRNWFDLFVPETARERQRAEFRRLLASRRGAKTHYTGDILTTDGMSRTVAWDATRLKDVDSRTTAVTMLGEDITERLEQERNVRLLAYYDQLTGLPNRSLFYDRVAQAIARAQQRREKLGVLFIDLDNLKTVNDTLGHHAGDELLRAVGERLGRAVQGEDTIARTGGDEFIALLGGVEGAHSVAHSVRRIQDILRQPFPVAGQEHTVTASIGIAVYPSDGEDINTLLKHADTAMYWAKENGRNRYQFFSPVMNESLRQRTSLEQSLKRALAEGELTLHYQPIVDTAAGSLAGLEALLRWQHPERGTISPAEFIPLAEETGLIVPVGEWVLTTVCEQIRAWHRAGLDGFRVSVNLSARQIHQEGLLETVEAALHQNGLDPSVLGLEITESAALQDVDLAVRTLSQLRRLGIEVSLDDFGTGYSALSYLRSLPIDALKLDRSFIHDLGQTESSSAIASAVIYLAHQLNLRVVAEGVETPGQLDFLRSQGCDRVQGYLCCRPSPAAELEELLRRRGLALPPQ